MVKLGLYVRLEAKAGKEKEVEKFLKDGLEIVYEEPDTITWYALKLGPKTYAIFDTFEDEEGRSRHLSGKVAAALMSKADELLETPPSIQKLEIMANK